MKYNSYRIFGKFHRIFRKSPKIFNNSRRNVYWNCFFLLNFLQIFWELLFSYGIFKGQYLTCQARHTKETEVVNHSLDHDLLFDIYGFLRNCTLFYLQCFIFIERILLRIFPLIDVHSILCKTDNTMFAFTLKSMTWIRKTYIFYS